MEFQPNPVGLVLKSVNKEEDLYERSNNKQN